MIPKSIVAMAIVYSSLAKSAILTQEPIRTNRDLQRVSLENGACYVRLQVNPGEGKRNKRLQPLAQGRLRLHKVMWISRSAFGILLSMVIVCSNLCSLVAGVAYR